MRPIDADALREHAWMLDHPDRFSEYVVSEDDINEAPTLDVVPVRHGRWIQGKWATYPDGYVCDQCSTGYAIPYSYCPNCGAKMDAKEE